ncbi:MAG TPA: DinB family protein [Cyclobacteriaceae bacterium]|nr:DinB family protein [Cyclobacteriaceae bacterium]
MKSTIAELNNIVFDFSEKISAIPDDEFSAKPLPSKWSKKEVLGHLIDSAQNNLRRFICGQYESMPPKITYNQDLWVDFNGYPQTNKAEVIALWTLMNKRIAAVLEKMPAASYSKSSDTGRESVALHSLAWLADDYVKHLKHHLNQIIPGSFAIRYP